MNFRTIAAALVLVVLAAVAWYYRWPIENSLHPHHAATPLVPGQALPHITAIPIGGAQAQPIGPAPGRFLFINVFATWCAPCKSETPALKRLSDEIAGGSMQIVGIDQHESDDAVNRFSQTYGLKYPMYVSRDSMTTALLGVHYIPVTIIVDPAGVVRANVIGPMSYERMHALVQQVVGPQAFHANG
jgi:cytochrome c biogenesis protein CcmG, thiol:disulfide interchange protein DsbE